MTNYNDGKWHAWNGGECPVHPETLVDVTYTCGAGMFDEDAEGVSWTYPLLFRVTKEYRGPREFWLVGCYRFLSEKDAMTYEGCLPNRREIIHVVEKLED